jgi:hypothetical protein
MYANQDTEALKAGNTGRRKDAAAMTQVAGGILTDAHR